MDVFGDILHDSSSNYTFNFLQKIIKRPYIKPQYRISVLNPDESVDYVIPSRDIPKGGISYTEDYQNGQRRNITLELINIDGKYTPSINGLWMSTKFRFDIGITYQNEVIWFPKGVYIMGDVKLTEDKSNKIVSLQLKDKYAIFEGKMGTLQDPFEIPVDSDIIEALNGIRNFSVGNGYILDPQEFFYDPSFIGARTQQTIRVEEGSNLGEVISSIATQLSAEYYYNNLGQLCFYPINETIDDSNKPVIWVFDDMDRDLDAVSLSYKYEEVINVVKVTGENIDKQIFSAVVMNENPYSPICVQQVGKRISDQHADDNIWSNELAKDLANYYLRQSSFTGIDFSCTVAFNPILTVNNVCEAENKKLEMQREKLLITSISFSSEDGHYSLNMCNTKELPSVY